MMAENQLVQKIGQVPQNIQILYQNIFTLHYMGQIYPECHALLSNSAIYIRCQDPNRIEEGQNWVINYSFDLTFEIITSKNNFHPLNNTLGLNFERFLHKLQLLNAQQNITKKWAHQLATLVKQRGFHELFKPVQLIGQGSFANVYLAENVENKVQYAIKAFSKKQLLQEQGGKQILENEIRIMRSINQKNVMKLHGVYESKNSIYMCFEHYEGGSLNRRLKRTEAFSEDEIRAIMRSILEGVRSLHSQGIMHRDLKPSNIMLRDKKGTDCVLADFGLSAFLDQAQEVEMCGTPGFIAPEMLGGNYGCQCDIFSVGIILHCLLFKASPFFGEDETELMEHNMQCFINFSSPQYQELPQQMFDLLRQMLERDPSQRITAEAALKHNFLANKAMEMDVESENEQSSLRLILAEKDPNAESSATAKPQMKRDNFRHKGFSLNQIGHSSNQTMADCKDQIQ